jgi:DNA-directed RNA polymerase specialized sigma24 family protein
VPAGTVKSYLSRARARLRERAPALGIEGVE